MDKNHYFNHFWHNFYFSLSFFIGSGMPMTYSSYKISVEKNRAYAEQKQEEWLNSEEYKKLGEESFKKSCELAKEALKNWQEGEPLPLLPNGCE